MPARRNLLLMLTLILAILIIKPATANAEDVAISKGPFDYGKVSLDEIQRNPRNYLNRYVTFECKYFQSGGFYKEVQTGLLEVLHQNFVAWSPSARLWIADDFSKKASLTFYIFRTSTSFKTYLKLEKFERIVVWAQVKSDLGGVPWFEVREIEKASGPNIDGDFLSRINQGYRYLNLKFYEKALASLLSAHKNNLPDVEEGYICSYIGECYYQLGNYRAAVKYFDRAVSFFPGDTDLVEKLIKAYYKARNYDKAIKLSKDILAKNPNLHDIRIFYALSKGKTGDIDGGLRELEYVLLRDKYNITAFEARAELFEMKKDYSKAISTIENAILIDQQNVRLQYNRARLFQLTGNLEGAIEGYNVVLSLNPNYAPALLALAQIAMTQGRNAEAAAYLERVAVSDMSPVELLQLGMFYAYNMNQMEKGLSYLEMAIEKDPNFIDAIIAIADINLSLNNLSKAEDWYVRAIAIDPTDFNARVGYVRSLLWQGKKTSLSLTEARKLYTEFSTSPIASALLGYALTLSNKTEDGYRMLTEASALVPGSQELLLYLGINLLEQEKYAEAVETLKKAIEGGGVIAILAKPFLDDAEKELNRENARINKNLEIERRAQEKKALAERRAEERRIAREDRDKKRKEEKLRKQQEREAKAAAKKSGVSSPRTATVAQKTAPGTARIPKAKYVKKSGKTRPTFAISKETEKVAKTEEVSYKGKSYYSASAKISDEEILKGIDTTQVPKEFILKYGYKAYRPIRIPAIKLSDLKDLPSVDEAKARILAAMDDGSYFPEVELEALLKRLDNESVKLSKGYFELLERMEKAKAKSLSSSEYRMDKALKNIMAEQARDHAASKYELRFYNRRIEKAMAKLQKRNETKHLEMAKELRSINAYSKRSIEDHMAAIDKVKAKLDEAVKTREARLKQIDEEVRAMRSSVNHSIDKIERIRAEKELQVMDEAKRTLARIQNDLSLRDEEFRKMVYTRKSTVKANVGPGSIGIEKETKEILAKLFKDIDERQVEMDALAEKIVKDLKKHDACREESLANLKRLQEAGDKLMEKDAREKIYNQELSKRRARELRAANESRQIFKDMAERHLNKRISSSERKLLERMKARAESIAASNDKIAADVKARLEKVESEHEKARKEAEELARKMAEAREKIRKEVEKQMAKYNKAQQP